MPPRRKSTKRSPTPASRSASRSKSGSRKSTTQRQSTEARPPTPTVRPDVVNRLVDEALARAAKKREGGSPAEENPRKSSSLSGVSIKNAKVFIACAFLVYFIGIIVLLRDYYLSS